MSSTDLRDVAAAVQERVSYLTCATEAPADDGWIMCSALVADPALRPTGDRGDPPGAAHG